MSERIPITPHPKKKQKKYIGWFLHSLQSTSQWGYQVFHWFWHSCILSGQSGLRLKHSKQKQSHPTCCKRAVSSIVQSNRNISRVVSMSAIHATLDKGVMPKGSAAMCISALKCSSSLNCSGLFTQPATVIPSTMQALGSSFNSSVDYEFQDLSDFSLKVFHLPLQIFKNRMCGKTTSPPPKKKKHGGQKNKWILLFSLPGKDVLYFRPTKLPREFESSQDFVVFPRRPSIR